MCRVHRTEYTRALRKASVVRTTAKAGAAKVAGPGTEPITGQDAVLATDLLIPRTGRRAKAQADAERVGLIEG